MRILLTGSTGMVGRNLLEHAAAATHEIVAPERRELDLLDSKSVREFIRTLRPQAVIHTAGTVGGIQANMRHQARFLVENADMGRNIIMGAFQAGVRRLINLGSSCMYPRDCECLLSEDMLLTGQLEPTNEGYALAKNLTARLCHYLNRENPGLKYKTLIPCNLYGRWDHYGDLERSHLMAAIVTKVEQAIRRGETEILIWGSGSVRREFLYASDLADAIFWCLDHMENIPDFLNCGTGVDHTVNEYYQAAASAAGYRGRFVYDADKPDGMKRKLLDIARMSALGWTAKTDLKSGIAASIQFYRSQTAAATLARA